MESSSDDEFYDCQSEPIKYYAVACQKDKGKGIVTTDINEARIKLKNSRASRFCSFYDPLEAKKFADTPLSDDSEISKKKSVSQKKISDPFPNASQRDLNVLKGAIETGNSDKVRSLVWNNPRHLVTESDSPTLLQVRFRHNALHVAVNFNQAEILCFILESISQQSFWTSIYPTADDKCNKLRMHRVLDMYLNAPEIGNLETPCHLAAKFGHKECLRILLGEELTDRNLKNKSGFRAEEIICQRSSESLNENKIGEIRQIFSEKYVVLLDGDGGQVLEPISHCELLRLLRQRRRNDGYKFDSGDQLEQQRQLQGDVSVVVDVPGFVRAYVGPLDQLRAKQLYYRWSVLNAEDASKFEEIRRCDAEKGMEAHGRFLAELFGVPWRELWQFLDKYVDFGSNEGLQHLEEHLAKQQSELQENLEGESALPLDSFSFSASASIDQSNSVLASSSASSSASSGVLNSLVRMFSRLTLRSRTEGDQISSSVEQSVSSKKAAVPPVLLPASPAGTAAAEQRHSLNHCCDARIITSTPIQHNKNKPIKQLATNASSSLRLQRMPFNMSLTGEGILTPTDRHVRLAVLSGRCKPPQQFPRVTEWLEDLSQIDPNQSFSFSFSQQNISLPPPISPPASAALLRHPPQCMSTPIRSTINTISQFKKPQIPDFQRCLSPLSQIELSD